VRVSRLACVPSEHPRTPAERGHERRSHRPRLQCVHWLRSIASVALLRRGGVAGCSPAAHSAWPTRKERHPSRPDPRLQHSTPGCNTAQHVATQYNTLQHSPPCCYTAQYMAGVKVPSPPGLRQTAARARASIAGVYPRESWRFRLHRFGPKALALAHPRRAPLRLGGAGGGGRDGTAACVAGGPALSGEAFAREPVV
jgi:hypothetical protein